MYKDSTFYQLKSLKYHKYFVSIYSRITVLSKIPAKKYVKDKDKYHIGRKDGSD